MDAEELDDKMRTLQAHFEIDRSRATFVLKDTSKKLHKEILDATKDAPTEV